MRTNRGSSFCFRFVALSAIDCVFLFAIPLSNLLSSVKKRLCRKYRAEMVREMSVHSESGLSCRQNIYCGLPRIWGTRAEPPSDNSSAQKLPGSERPETLHHGGFSSCWPSLLRSQCAKLHAEQCRTRENDVTASVKGEEQIGPNRPGLPSQVPVPK